MLTFLKLCIFKLFLIGRGNSTNLRHLWFLFIPKHFYIGVSNLTIFNQTKPPMLPSSACSQVRPPLLLPAARLTQRVHGHRGEHRCVPLPAKSFAAVRSQGAPQEISHRCLEIADSQNGGGRKGPLWVTQSNPLPKQGHPEQAAQDLRKAGAVLARSLN